MKSSPLIVLVLLAFLLSVHPAAAMHGSDTAKLCCFRYSTKMLPRSWVQSYELTQSSCPQQAVVFTTKRGKKVCVQLKEKWVQKYISLLRTQKQP
ncbi:C-C motif chemokine 26 [Fukomys damarensis]|uniref:C-C motif chemokine 26 n=1 Tax=Fukomys damarensis TaxID=885580 RepID=UPI00053F8D5E|nr:C-C motif chemokine 26 [Fukomys damarensis]XP_033620662.1 C-C motif chemokine 26 [Fukomys damarensis]